MTCPPNAFRTGNGRDRARARRLVDRRVGHHAYALGVTALIPLAAAADNNLDAGSLVLVLAAASARRDPLAACTSGSSCRRSCSRSCSGS